MSQERDVSGKCILKREKGETRPARNAKSCPDSRSWHSATVSANHRCVAARSRANAETSRVRHQGLGGKQRGIRQVGSAGARTMVDGGDWFSRTEIPQIRDVDIGTALGEMVGPRLHHRTKSPFGNAGAPMLGTIPDGRVLGVGLFISAKDPTRGEERKL